MISSREQVTQMIVAAKVRKGLKWAHVAESIGMSGVDHRRLPRPDGLRQGPGGPWGSSSNSPTKPSPGCRSSHKGSLPTAVPTDPLIYRWYELVNVYGTTIKELIHEEFGDGIMSAIDFSMDIQRQSDPKGDRVNVVLSGKFLPYKSY